jgi:short-subunit dehydrogenase
MQNIKNKTALITGASSGIGKSLAMKLAEAGVNLVLVARSEIALQQLAEKLNKTYNVRCDVIVADLSLPNCGISLRY